MKSTYLIVESAEFSRWWLNYFGSDDSFAEFQVFLVENPSAGAVIKGCSPLRKVRWRQKSRGKGARGGLRVIYLHLPRHSIIYLLDVYGKDDADDLSEDERSEIKRLAQRLEKELDARKG